MQPGWIRVVIGDKPADVYDPGGVAFGAVLFLHPLGEESPADNDAYTQAIREAGLPVVAPHGRRSWWADRICPEFDTTLTAERHLLANVVPWIASRWSLKPGMIAAAGVSMGGQGAIRLGIKYPDQFPIVAGVASAFDYQDWYGLGDPLDTMYPSREAVRQDTAILHLAGPPWPRHIWFACDPADEQCFRGNDRLHEKMTAYGIPHTIDFHTTHGGHCWEYFDLMARPMMQFLRHALEQERRRLL